ncbi:response regulator [bacterium]|nr:response regulator [bacterium]
MRADGMDSPSSLLSAEQLKSLKVLIVDPNAFLRGVLADSLRRLQVVDITGAPNASEAFNTGRHLKPSIMFVDWDAGRMSGLEFTREIRRNTTGIGRETPIVLLATEVSHEQLMDARQAGINELLLKPISAYSVLTRIEEIVIKPRKFIDSRNYIGPCRRRREAPEFAGPWRRLSDQPALMRSGEALRNNAVRLREIIARLTEYADSTANDRSTGIRGMYAMLSDNADEVSRLGDDVVVRVWRCALRYIEGVGMTDAYSVDVVKYHFQTVARILDMPDEAHQLRTAVAGELERLVAKKIHGSAAPLLAKAS